MDDTLLIDPPLYLLTSQAICRNCDGEMPVAALLAEKVEGEADEPCLLSNIAQLPTAVLAFIHGRCPAFRWKRSKTIETSYFANNCPQCGRMFGDHYLSGQPGGPFFPIDDEKYRAIRIERVPLDVRLSIRADLAFGIAREILNNVRVDGD